MSLKKVEQVKKDKGFRLFDLIIYGVISVLVAIIFIVVFTTRNTDPLTGVRIYVNSEVVFEYEFGGADPEKSDSVDFDDKGITVTVTTEDGGINIVYIDKSAKTVKMTEVNCKGKQCMYFPVMSNNAGFIYCSPHGVKIEPFNVDLDNPLHIA